MIERLEKLLAWGGIKRDIAFLVLSGVALVLSLAGAEPFPFSIAWIAIILCGVPIILEAVIGLVTAFDITADVLVSLALIASVWIGEDFAAGEVAFIMQLGGLLEELTVERARAGIERLVHLTPRTARRIARASAAGGEPVPVPEEVVAAEAERSSVKYKLVEFMQDKVGYEFEGHISGLTDWGMYVEIEPTKIEGMVALRDIRSDFYEFDEEKYRIVGRSSKTVYNLGDPVKIRVKKANLEQKLLDYELVETGLEEKLEDRDMEAMKAERAARKAARKEKIRNAIRSSAKKKSGRRSRKQ